MSETTNGNGGNGYLAGGAAQLLDRKIDSVERDLRDGLSSLSAEFRGDLSNLRAEFGKGLSDIVAKIDASTRPTNPYNLIFASGVIITILGGAGAYVASNLAGTISAVSTTLTASIATVSTTLTAAVESNAKAIEKEADDRVKATEKEADDRIADRRRVYDSINEKDAALWSRGEQGQFEKRIDERNALEAAFAIERQADMRDRLATVERTLSGSLDRLAEHVNQSDAANQAKFADVDKAIHGYGLVDQVKALGEQVQRANDQIFQLVAKLQVAPKSPTPAD